LVVDRENLKYYKIKYAAQLTDGLERNVFNYVENEALRKEGALHGFYKYKQPADRLISSIY
jgi:hypothetical protein